MTKETTESVLLSAKYSPSCYTCIRSFARHGIRTVVASPHEEVPAFASRFCDESVVTPSPQEDLVAYKDALVSLARRPDVGTIVPIWEEDAYVLSKYGDEFEAHVAGAWPSLDRLRRVQDRLRLADVAEAAGVAVPKTQSFDAVENWDRELIVKSRYNLLADEYLDSMSPSDSELNKTLRYPDPGERPDRDAVLAEMHHIPVVQELVDAGGDEFAFFALYDRGDPVATFQHRQVRGRTYAGSTSAFRESVDIPELADAGRALFDHLDWHGVAEAEFLRDAETGEFKLMEVNPRMWASISCAVEAGADFPYYYWSLANGEFDRSDAGFDHSEPGYETKAGTHSLFGEASHVYSVLREDYPNVERPPLGRTLWEIVTSCYDQPNFEYLHLDDPGPFVRGLRNALPVDR